MYEKLTYNDLVIKYLLLSLPVLLISGPLLPEIAMGIIFFLKHGETQNMMLF